MLSIDLSKINEELSGEPFQKFLKQNSKEQEWSYLPYFINFPILKVYSVMKYCTLSYYEEDTCSCGK